MAPKRKFSVLWNYFTEEGNKKRAKCNLCSQSISISNGSNGNLSRHMKSKHPLTPLTDDSEQQEKTSADSGTEIFENDAVLDDGHSSSKTSVTQLKKQIQTQSTIMNYVRKLLPVRKVEQINKQVLKMIAKGHHALRIVEETEFKKLIEMVSHCPGYQLPTRKTLSENLLTKIHNEVTSQVKTKINDSQAVCLTTDGWTSRTNESYMAVTAHYIDGQNKLSSALLGCIQHNERHTSQNLCNFLKDIMAEWGIQKKLLLS